MLNEQIVFLQDKLNNMLLKEVDYEEIYAVSIELDKLIVEYYKQVRGESR